MAVGKSLIRLNLRQNVRRHAEKVSLNVAFISNWTSCKSSGLRNSRQWVRSQRTMFPESIDGSSGRIRPWAPPICQWDRDSPPPMAAGRGAREGTLQGDGI